ncbi:MAG: hypothetical protein NNA25_03625 [Nitrospira sp.]|nr:hypothetical protein [Nitrospira sp.]
MDAVLTKTLSLLDGVAVVMIAFLAGPVRLGVRLAQWTRHRLKKPPLAPFWTHRVWLVYEAVIGVIALHFLYLEVVYILEEGFHGYFASDIRWQWSVMSVITILSYIFLAHRTDEFPSRPLTPEEWAAWVQEEEKRRDRERELDEYWREVEKRGSDLASRTGSYAYMDDD